MNGFDRLKTQVEKQDDDALKQVVEYLLSREDMEQKYLNEEKTIEEMCNFITRKGKSHAKNGWNFITNEVVFAWAIMYFSLPNEFLKINKPEVSKKTNNPKSNIISFEQASKRIESKKQIQQLTLFGGVE